MTMSSPKPILNTSLPPGFRQIRIELAREAGHPDGAHGIAYVIVAPLDDDDEFVPDHVEALLNTAKSGRFEVAYGNILQRSGTAAEPDVQLRSYPPQFGQYGFQEAVYHGRLL